MLVEIEVQTVPNFKGTINVKMEPGEQECDGIFNLHQMTPNLGCLLLKTGFGDSDMHTTAQYVYIHLKIM